ncbi:MAG: RnfABCDGE type electron transport complex subunit G [Oscillospiraceae bacterium]|nr:RnfABCDGE type electron transport complex subunit G [Oscillospiraceae bacterium]
MNNKNVKEIVMPALILFLIVFAAVAILAWCNSATYDKIQQINAENAAKARQCVLPKAKQFEEVSDFKGEGIVKNVFEGRDGDKKVGYCVSVTPSGYGGEMEIMVGVDDDLKIAGIEIVSSSETAGLGKNASKESFKSQFVGLTKEITVNKNAPDKNNNEIQALSGATITSNAVSSGANAAIDAVKKIKEAAK